MNEENSLISQKLRELRKRAGYSMSAFARAAGYTPQGLSFYEVGYNKEKLPWSFVNRIKPLLMARGVPEDEVDALSDAGEAIRLAVTNAAPAALDEECYRLAREITLEISRANGGMSDEQVLDTVEKIYKIAIEEKAANGIARPTSVTLKWSRIHGKDPE